MGQLHRLRKSGMVKYAWDILVILGIVLNEISLQEIEGKAERKR